MRLDLSKSESSDYEVREIGTDSGSQNVDWASISSGVGGRDKRLKNLKRSQSKNHLFYTKGESYVVVDVRGRKSRNVSRSRSKGRKKYNNHLEKVSKKRKKSWE